MSKKEPDMITFTGEQQLDDGDWHMEFAFNTPEVGERVRKAATVWYRGLSRNEKRKYHRYAKGMDKRTRAARTAMFIGSALLNFYNSEKSKYRAAEALDE